MSDQHYTAQDIMNRSPTVVRSDDVIRDAIRIVMTKRYRALPVVDAHGCFLGVFGVHCLLRQVLPKAVQLNTSLQSLPFVSESLTDLRQRLAEIEDKSVVCCMATDVPVVRPDTTMVETMLKLYQQRVSLPVVEEQSCRLLGVISYFDVGEHILNVEV